MQRFLNSHLLVRIFSSKPNRRNTAVEEVSKKVMLANQKYSLMLRGAAVRCNPLEYLQNLTHATENTKHPEYLYAALYSTMTTQWVQNFNGSQVYNILDKLERLKFDCTHLLDEKTMNQSKSSKKKVDDHVGEQRIVMCRLFLRVLSVQGNSPVAMIESLNMISRCNLKWEHVVTHMKQFSASVVHDHSLVLKPLIDMAIHLSCRELKDLFLCLQKLEIKWGDLSPELQTTLMKAVSESFESFISHQSVAVIYSLSQMELPLIELQAGHRAFCRAVYTMMGEALLDDSEIHHASYADHILAAIVDMNFTYVQLPLSVNRAIDQCVNGMDEKRLNNMADILLALKMDHSRLNPNVLAVIKECEKRAVEESQSVRFVRPSMLLSEIESDERNSEASRTDGEAADASVATSDAVPSSVVTAGSTAAAADAPSSLSGSVFQSLFAPPSPEQESVFEIEDLIHEELATTYRSGNDKQFIESLKAVLEEVDLNGPTRQKYFSNELLFLRYLTPEWIKQVNADLIPDLMECLVLMRCGYNMMEKKFVWTVITQFFNDLVAKPDKSFKTTDREFLITMSYLESISAHFNQHEVLNAFKVLSSVQLMWSSVPTSVQAALLRSLKQNSALIAPRDALVLLECLAKIEFDVEQTFRSAAAVASEMPSERQMCHEILSSVAVRVIKSFETDLRFAIGGHKSAGLVLSHLGRINFPFGLMDEPLVDALHLHIENELKRRQLASLHEMLDRLRAVKFQFGYHKARILPRLFESCDSFCGDNASWLNTTLSCLSTLGVHYEQLQPKQKRHLMECVRDVMEALDLNGRTELLARLKSIKMPAPVLSDSAETAAASAEVGKTCHKSALSPVVGV